MKRLVLFLLLLCFCLVRSSDYAHANRSENNVFSGAIKNLYKSQPLKSAEVFLRHQTPIGTSEEEVYFATVDNEDEDDTYKKHIVLVRSIAFFYAFLFNHDAEAIANQFPYWQHQTLTGSPRYIRLRVIRI